jgi:hypothetical protein
MKRSLDQRALLDEAENKFLLGGEVEFNFSVRRTKGDEDFYIRLDREIREQDIVRIKSYRMVKEGFTKVSRPAELIIDLNQLVRERPYVVLFRNELEKLNSIFKHFDLFEFLKSQDRETILDLNLLRSCLEVFAYLLDYSDKAFGLLPRQIPHGQSTKLIGKQNLLLRMFNFWQKQVGRWSDFYDWFGLIDQPPEFRIFAPHCYFQKQELKNFHGLLANEWIADFAFSNLCGTLIVENLESFHALTKNSKASLLVWGAGFKASYLRPLLSMLPKPVYYWGDIDKEGYEILGLLHTSFTDIKPVLMNFDTIEKYRQIHQKKEIFLGPYRPIGTLQDEYEYSARHGLLIEQEQMQEDWPMGTQLE